MNPTVLDISMSLDGFVAGPNRTPEAPLGERGDLLHQWLTDGDEVDSGVLERGAASAGAVICGRRTYDDSLPWWGPNGPTGPARTPVFVVTHRAPGAVPDGGVYTFVAEGIEAALHQARAAAGDKLVCVMGGAEIARQYLEAGLIDEVSIHLAPVLLGAGTSLFGSAEVRGALESTETIATPAATHLRFRIEAGATAPPGRHP